MAKQIVKERRDITGSNQGCSLGLDVSVSRRSRDVVSKRLGLVSVSWERRKVSVSISSRTENQMSRSRLGLVPEGLVYKPICTAFCFIAKLHVHRVERRAILLYCLLIHKLKSRLHPCCIHLQLQWRGGVTVRHKSCSRQRCVTTLGKLFTPMCLCHQAV